MTYFNMGNRKRYEWFNEASEAFMRNKESYLQSRHEHVAERVMEIGRHAEKILGQPGFADEFEEYMSRGYYSLSTPIWTNFGNNRGLGISCVTGDTWINTASGGKMAKDIQIGDLLLTHKNRFRPVSAIIPTKNRGDIWKLKVETRMTNLYITGDHLVLTNLGWVRVDELDLNTHLVAVNGKLEYEGKDYTIDLKQFTTYNHVIVDGKIAKKIETTSTKVKKKNKSNAHVTSYATPNEFVEVTNDVAWALGLWFAEGSLSINERKQPNGIRITLNSKDEVNLGQKWFDVMTSAFGLNGNIYKSTVVRGGKENSWIHININGDVIGNFFASFGKGAKEKTMPDWMLNLPSEKLQCLLDGLLKGDGSIGRDKNYTVTLANPKLILQVYNIGLKLGKDMSLQMQTKARPLSTTAHVYTINFRNYFDSKTRNAANAGIKFHDGLVYCRIKELSKTDKIEDVYDFTVEEDHSFSCAGVVVHNCFNSYISDSMDSILYTAAEVGMMSKNGGGTSAYFGKLRPRGSEIKNNGKSSGSVHFMQLFDTITNIVSQGCYDEETEILTEKGWMSFSDLSKCWKTTKVAQVNDDESIEFVTPTQFFQYEVKENLLHFKDSKNIDLLVTKNHNMVFKYEKKSITKDENNVKRYVRRVSDKFKIATAEDCPLHRDVKFLHSGRLQESALSLSTLERLKIAYQADGYSTKDYPNYVKFKFAKKRKADRLEWLLKELGINYKYSFYEKDQTYNYFFSLDEPLSKTFDWVDLTNKSYQWASEFLLEVSEWDGSKTSKTGFIYSSVIKENVDIVQAIAACAGYKSKVKLNLRETEVNKQPIYNINLSRGIYFGVEKLKAEEVYYEGFVYCVEVPSHKLIVRRGGHTLVCGNSSRRGSFAAYLDINHPDIEEFLKIRTEGFPIQDISFGVCVPTWWLNEMRGGDQDKRRIWARVLQLRGEIGYPYIFFTDNVNNNTVDVYRDKKMTIYASNLCVAGDTKLLTRQGEIEIKSLAGKSVEVWNGEEWTLAQVEKTGENQRLIKVELSNGSVIYATEYHKWYRWDNAVFRTYELYPGMSLLPYQTPHGELVDVKVTHVGLDHKFEDSYCAREPKREKIVLNGILTGNCSEIALPTNENESFVCDLSSINLLHWDEIKEQPRVVHILVQLLDAVMTDFIERASKIKFMERAVEFAKNHRALGIGVLGLHSLYQSKLIPFESLKAKSLNTEIFKFLKEETYAESKRLAERFGEPSVLKGYGRRNTTLLAVAPTTSSAFILGQVSQSIEPYNSNYFVKDVAKGKFTIKNPFLTKLLEEKGKNDYDTWDSILKAGGSVQHLDFLSQHEKDVFKTFEEISQKEIIIQAAIRQRYIDQAQSLNLMIHPDTPTKDINELILFAHDEGIKTLYYQHSINSAKEFSRELLQCVNCE